MVRIKRENYLVQKQNVLTLKNNTTITFLNLNYVFGKFYYIKASIE